jgi:hypothetical protein
VTPHLATKMAAVAAHSSQVVEASTFMGLPAGAFHHLLATEWFNIARSGDCRFLDLVESTGGPRPIADREHRVRTGRTRELATRL